MKKQTLSLTEIQGKLSRNEMKNVKGGTTALYQCYTTTHNTDFCDSLQSKLMVYYQNQTASANAAFTTMVNGLNNHTCLDQVTAFVNGTGNYPYSC